MLSNLYGESSKPYRIVGNSTSATEPYCLRYHGTSLSNLEAMLRKLQYLAEARPGIRFLVNGLCINQGHVHEQNHQVGLMERIYNQALSTVIWLGKGNPSKVVAQLATG